MGTGKRPRARKHTRAGGESCAGTEERPPLQRELRGVAPTRRVRDPDALLEAVSATLRAAAVVAALPPRIPAVRAILTAALAGSGSAALLQALKHAPLRRHARADIARRLDEVLALDAATARRARRRSGSFYTPPLLVDALLEDALEPCLLGAVTIGELAALRIVDPASGSGAFLIPAARRFIARAQACGATEQEARALVATAFTAADIDELALMALRVRFKDEGLPSPLCLHGNALCGSGFTEPSAARGTTPRPAVINWRAACPEVAAQGGFDLVLGNPPFANAIEGGLACLDAEARALHYPDLPANADLAAVFLARALQLVRPTGRVGFVLPRSLLVVDGARPVRARALAAHGLERVRLPERADLFSGADVHVALLTLGPGRETAVETATGEANARWHQGRISDSGWWESIDSIIHPGQGGEVGAATIDEFFEVRSNFFVQDFYALKPCVRDMAGGEFPRLITTGLIEPGSTLWGTRPCRYGGRDYLHPRLDTTAMPEALRQKVDLQRGPKILVAGLARRVEAVLDAHGDLTGAVQTFRITPKKGGLRALRALVSFLNAPEATDWLRRRLGGNALSGGNISLRAPFLRTLPLPQELVQRLQAMTARATSPDTLVKRKSRPA